MTLDDLLAREAVRDLVTRYNSYGDSGKFDLLWPLFAADAVMEIISASGARATHTGLDEIKQIFSRANDLVAGPAGAGRNAGVYIRHSTATHQIDLVDADHGVGRCYFAVIIGPVGGLVGGLDDGSVDGSAGGLDHWGRYVDDYVRIDGAWRFQRRKVYVDGTSVESLFAGQ